MNTESDFQTFLPKPLLTLWAMATGLKIWLKSLILSLLGSLLTGIYGIYRLFVFGNWALVSVSQSDSEALTYVSGSELRNATKSKSRHLAPAGVLMSGFKGSRLFNSSSWGINPCRHGYLYTLKTKLL
jgi:hypothetical protein